MRDRAGAFPASLTLVQVGEEEGEEARSSQLAAERKAQKKRGEEECSYFPNAEYEILTIFVSFFLWRFMSGHEVRGFKFQVSNTQRETD